MIEVEVRGRLNQTEYDKLQAFMGANAEHLEHQDREMFLLFDYPGYDPDPNARELDIRLRNTNGECEIMVKRKAGPNNVARHETSLKLQDTDLETAKEVMKALGCTTGLKMHREKDVYMYKGVEWSVVKTPKNYYYFEAEKVAGSASDDMEALQQELTTEAESLGLTVFNSEEMKEFIAFLDKEVNEVVKF